MICNQEAPAIITSILHEHLQVNLKVDEDLPLCDKSGDPSFHKGLQLTSRDNISIKNQSVNRNSAYLNNFITGTAMKSSILYLVQVTRRSARRVGESMYMQLKRARVNCVRIFGIQNSDKRMLAELHEWNYLLCVEISTCNYKFIQTEISNHSHSKRAEHNYNTLCLIIQISITNRARDLYTETQHPYQRQRSAQALAC